MKRHQRLQDLSREHYSALKLALDAKHAAASGELEQIQAAAAACNSAFERELEAHFKLEERELLPLLRQSGEAILVQHTEADHAELRHLAAQLAVPDGDTLQRFAERLTAHVRFEEREMFEAVERLLVVSG
ncbi:MAG: hemerythrin domain-containing protein [Azonexus sp.]|jgi:hemerythrin-like domain-containing protein